MEFRIGTVSAAALVALVAIAPAGARATIIYDTLTGATEAGGDPVSLPPSGAGPILADRFVSPFDGTLTSVSLILGHPFLITSAGPSYTVDLFSDTGSGPGTATVLATLSDAVKMPFTVVTITPAATVSLSAGTAYWIGIANIGNSSDVTLGNTLTAAVLADPAVTLGASYYNSGGVQANSGGPYEIQVNATPNPTSAPAPAGAVAVAAGLLGLSRRVRG